MIDVIPGMLEKDFAEVLRKYNLVKKLVDWVHIDILDNTLIANETFNDFDRYKEISGKVNLEAHLMVSDPARYVQPLVDAGFKRLIAQIEGDTVREFIHEARIAGVEVGVAIDGLTSYEQLEPYLDQVDCVLVMMYRMGFSGQKFQPEQLEKIRKIKKDHPDLPVEVDGGTDDKSAPQSVKAGATRLASTSYLFWKNEGRIKEAIEKLKKSA